MAFAGWESKESRRSPQKSLIEPKTNLCFDVLNLIRPGFPGICSEPTILVLGGKKGAQPATTGISSIAQHGT
jgi:hypothetical protein